MTNEQIHGWKHFPLCDSHIHIEFDHPVDESAEILRRIMAQLGYEKIAIMGLPISTRCDDPANNMKALYIKSVMNKGERSDRCYAFAGPVHFYDGADTKDGYLRQAKRFYAMGFDGFKLLDGKPSLRKRLNRRLDDAVFDGFYGYCEENGIPVTIHLGDPAYFWDITKCSEYVIKAGWYCDETYPTLDDLRGEIEGILAKFPLLRLNLAHFYFLADDIDACASFFERHPNVSFDLTPGGEMFRGFQSDVSAWREYFIRYAGRIHYGTDTYNYDLRAKPEDYEGSCTHRPNLVRRMLETSEPFEDPSYGTLVPLDLPDDVLMKIYAGNFDRRLGQPRTVDAALAASESGHLLTMMEHGFITSRDPARDVHETDNLRTVCAYFSETAFR